MNLKSILFINLTRLFIFYKKKWHVILYLIMMNGDKRILNRIINLIIRAAKNVSAIQKE